ncbi:MAG: T9SS type A sorting domain-containing protein [Saprospiraceae bacterium]|nr:T9SS type A sorting domain-containing protein [Saprospiraceae bacterium]MCC6844540.1 T9SS type A sorting domain-containing protein [Saprospiraceae bacterium]
MKRSFLCFICFLLNSYCFGQIHFFESYRYNPSCNQCNGEVTLSLSGYYAPYYAYLYEQGYSRGSRSGPFYGSSLTLKGLCAKTYLLDIYDACGCFARIYVQLSSGALNVSYNTTNINCSSAFGGITLNTSNFSKFYISYRKTTESYENQIERYGPQIPISGLTPGAYILKIRDINGCEKNISFDITNQSYSVTSTVRNASCKMENGDVTFTVSGISYPYSIEYFGAKSGNIPSHSNSNLPIYQLPAGNYTFIFRDRNGCSQTYNITIETIDNIRPSINNTKTDCDGNNGALTILHSGVFTPYNIEYSGPGVINKLISNTSQNPVYINGLKAGQYSIKITDSRGCYIEKLAIVDNGFPWVNFESLQRDNCSKSGSFTISGYNFTKMTIFNPDGSVLKSTSTTPQVLSGLGGGLYKVIIESATCKKEYEVEVPSDGPEIEVVSQRPINCANAEGGYIEFQIKNGKPPYKLNYRHESETNYKSIQSIFIPTLLEGFYYINVVDQNGCSKLIKVDAKVIGGPTYKGVITRPAICYQQNGCLNISLSKTKFPYIITIKGPSNIKDTIIYDVNFSNCNLYPGDYLVSFIDANNCKSDTTIRIDDESHDVFDSNKLQLLKGSNQSMLIYNGMASNRYFQWGITCCRNNVIYDSIIGEGSNNIFYYGQGNTDTLISHLNKKNCLLWSKSYSDNLKRGCANLRYLNDIKLPCLTVTKEIIKTNSIKLFPNPTRSKLFFVNEDTNSLIAIKIFNSDSKLISSYFEDNTDFNRSTLDVESFSPGLYVIKFYLKGGYVETKKFLIM